MRLNLEENADKKIRLYMAKHDVTSKEKAINEIIKKQKV